MKAPSARPTIQTAKDRGITVVSNYSSQFILNKSKSILPRDRNKPIPSPSSSFATRAMFEPSLSDGGLRYPTCMMHRVGNRTDNRRRIRILGKRPNINDAPFRNEGIEY